MCVKYLKSIYDEHWLEKGSAGVLRMDTLVLVGDEQWKRKFCGTRQICRTHGNTDKLDWSGERVLVPLETSEN